MPTIRVSGVQMFVSHELEDNLPTILRHIGQTDADFLLFPEMSLTGYHGDFDDATARAAWGEIADACRESGVTALIGTGCKRGDATYIQTRIFTESGEVLGTHEKMVPTSGDRDFCEPGPELRTFEHHGVRFGCLICNDLWVTPGCGPYPDPRLTYQLGRQGARVIFHAIHSGYSACHTPYHESNLALRAVESQLHIVTANAAKEEGPVNAATGVVTPQGEWLVQCPREGEQTYTVEIEVAVQAGPAT
jgi:predicted amidohydrolase